LTYQNRPLDDPKMRKPDITYANDILNWQPNIDLEEGLIKTILFFKKFINESKK
jgi:nucleoside-diphosphate-sugar epimerase